MSRLRISCSTLLLLPCLLLANVAIAWGPHGHQVIGMIAEAHLNDAARRTVRELLDGGTLVEAGTWADEMRGSQDNPEFWSARYTASWHYINIERYDTYAESALNPRGDAYQAIVACMAILEGREVPQGVVREGLELYLGKDLHSAAALAFALRFYVHLIEDLHQPIHLGYPEDRGGNTIDIVWQGERINLHALWDTQLIVYNTRGTGAHAASLASMNLPQDTVAQTDPLLWINEALPLRDDIYTVSKGTLDAGAYHARFYPLAAERLHTAGLRLAHYLNWVFQAE